MIQLNEQQRVAAYQQGWNDAQRGRLAQKDQSIMYQIGYVEAMRNVPNRFQAHEDEVAQ